MSEIDDLKDNIIYKLIVLDVLKEKYNWNEV
jgi:hypothetical protein